MDMAVLMPFNRLWALEPMLSLLHGKNVTWVPCFDDPTLGAPLFELAAKHPWVVPHRNHARRGCWQSINSFASSSALKLDTWYQLATDDTVWNGRFFEHVNAAIADGVEAVLSSQRKLQGYFAAERRFLGLFGADTSQLCVKGSLLCQYVFNDKVWFADGLFAEWLCDKHIDKVAYAPNAVTYYNALRPECWGFPANAQPGRTAEAAIPDARSP